MESREMESREALRDSSQTQTGSSQTGSSRAAGTGVSGPAGAPAQVESPAQSVNPFAPDDGRRVSKEEYWARWYENPYPDIDVSYEWNNGRLEAKPLPNHPQIRQYRWFSLLLDCYVQVNPIARFIDLETGVSMTVLDSGVPSGKWDVVYKPDIGVVLNDNPAPWGAVELRAFEGVCDMIVEEVSDSTLAEVRRDTEEKKRGYALAGVKEYFILDPADRYMRFYRLTASRRYAEIRPDAAGVIRSQVLPGFQFRRRDLLTLPVQEELALDDVYSGYVIPALQIAVTEAEEEAAARREAERRREEEAQRAQEEAAARQAAEQRAEAEAAARRAEAQRADAAEQRAQAEAAARRKAEERMRAMEDELNRQRRQSS
ncbi:MAG: Uma2 family endonuclease [Caldilineaceae bacterium SB0661_bin_32]|uniref:Uma2 family endonuclease n=1 Tax=Caldilineaceae bacterium SB0661_bin_32 TaxID=2605255 RepID=A0A6B1D232_9CHLR|nr:Uma2 family endonuclease [Caldilineaceae bacterium SB0661_bin_32]